MSYLATARKSLRHIRESEPAPQTPVSEGGSPQEAEIGSMSLDEFAEAGLIVEVHSKLLNKDLLFVSDNVSEQEVLNSRSLPVYRAAEMKRLAVMQPSPHSLRWIHEAKAIFGGEISDVR